MVRGAAQRHRKIQAFEGRQQAIEQHQVFQRELPCEPPGALVVDGEPPLHAAQIVAIGGEQRLAQLAGVGTVLGVEHADVVATRQGERIIERLRFGARLAVRHDDDLERRQQVQLACGGNCVGVDALQDQLDVELSRRIVRYSGANATSETLEFPRPPFIFQAWLKSAQ